MKKLNSILFLFLITLAGALPAHAELLTPRSGHTTTLLPNGDILVTGGRDASGNVLSSCELYVSSYTVWKYTTPMTVSRSSHTATLLPDGTVMVYGGFLNNTGTISNTYQIFNPVDETWT